MSVAERHGNECWKCHAKIAAAVFCPECEVIQHLPAGVDLFEVLGMPRSLRIDPAELERRYHEASRAVHPDRHQTAEAREQSMSLTASAAVNRAYRMLRDPVARGRYWLELHGARLGEANNRVPPALAAEVFEAQEKLEEFRAAPPGPARDAAAAEVREVRDAVGGRLRRMKQELEQLYAGGADGDALLNDLKRRLTEIAYLNTLLGDVEATLGEETGGPYHRH
jgi:molecular chaperone HscB